MSSLSVTGLGGRAELEGEIAVSGAKNAVLPLMAAAALLEGETMLTNVPDIADVASMGKLLEGTGAFITRGKGTLAVDAKKLSGVVFDHAIAKSLRASIILIGPILARLGRVTFPHPGGDVIGERPIDLFISGFEKLGAKFSESGELYTLEAPQGLRGGEIFFRVVSVTATETLMMAATLAKGAVTLKNCAMEPEVVAVAEFLKTCGARVEGAGTPTVIIFPAGLQVPALSFQVLPDRIEAATYLVLGALAGKKLTVLGAEPTDMDATIQTLWMMGVPLSINGSSITVAKPDKLLPTGIRTHEYPGLATDVQPPLTVLLTQADGESVVRESVFDGRLAYTKELVQMGANIEMETPHRARIKGPTPLKGADIMSPDIRAGLAFILAAAVAKGESKIGNAELIDRGYERIEEKLSKIGLSIKRVKE
jgi:UDP-N-acetylglucosamine 1-carboxyvinyltransferase